jgi:hypothetical protein
MDHLNSKTMKRLLKIKALIVLFTLSCAFPVLAQKVVLNPNEYTGPIQISKEDFPKGNVVNLVGGWGGLAVAINEAPAGTDFTPFLVGLKDDLCQVPHWGYLEKGKMRIIDKDKNVVVVNAGGVFYMPPGHTVIVDEDIRLIDFSPEHEMKELTKHVKKKVAEMEANK